MKTALKMIAREGFDLFMRVVIWVVFWWMVLSFLQTL